MFKCGWSILFTLAMSALSTAAANAAIIHFKPAAEVRSGIVHLGDVAEVRDSDAATVERLENMSLSPAPAPGRQLRLEFITIRSRLQALGLNLADAEFTGSSTIVVTAANGRSKPRKLQFGQTLRDRRLVPDWRSRQLEKLLAQAVEQELTRREPDLGKMTVSVQFEQKNISDMLQAFRSDYDIQGGKPPWDAQQRMTLRFLDRNKTLIEIPFVCRIVQTPFVVAVKYTVPKGHVLRADDLAWTQAEDSASDFDRFEQVIGRETKRTIRKDEPIRADEIQAVPLVRSNDIVTVYSRSPGITVKRPFKARGSGAMGDTVALVSLDGRQRVVARITGYHEAETIGSNAGPRAEGVQDLTGRIQFRSAQPRANESGRRNSRLAPNVRQSGQNKRAASRPSLIRKRLTLGRKQLRPSKNSKGKSL